ncbi:CYFA0S29e00188g1_1 [Cyberlindnera fabianii]|uniref:CYFA0S29e00188g1_1 n=1 Tax=Cyberlindnera fabianii TaxID=36022 RepID=A0A061BGV9_CYBFA|nr:Uracil permease [Cyberlindnera fabianii]CDR47118.1 CYFA0S29e00188g1_1 [Cyberlindnera fabianii]
MVSFRNIHDRVKLPLAQGTYSDGVLYSNRDLDPVPQWSDERKWNWFSNLGFWIAEAMSISMYQVASSSITLGLSPGLAVCAIIVGHVIVSIPAMLNAMYGARYGLGFPALMRVTAGASTGICGAHIMVAIRGIVCILWTGTQTLLLGQCIQSMLTAIWPSFAHFHNALPESAEITSAGLLCFFLGVIVQIPALYLTVNQLRWLFTIKVVVGICFTIVLFAWAVHGAKGFGPIFRQGNNITDGTPTVVVFFRCMVSAIGPKATLALNISDFTRYAKKPKQVWWPQFVGLVVLVTICGLLGIIVTSATKVIYNETTWSPLQVEALWQNRAGQFFASSVWAYSTLLTNISANTVSFSYDLSLLFPRYVNARRGAYICLLLGILSCPWYVQNSAASFSAFLGGYSMFLGPIAGIMCTDYWILRKRQINVPGIYKHDGPYRFFHGWNPACFIAFIIGIAPNLPGLAYICGNKSVPIMAYYVYSFSYVTGIVLAAIAYYLICTLFPSIWMADMKNFVNDPGHTFERPMDELDGVELGSSSSLSKDQFVVHTKGA